MLEVGCGTGNYIGALSDFTGCKAFGVDPTEAMLDIAKKRAHRVSYSLNSAEDLDFENDSFDFVFSIDVIHFVGDHGKAFQEAARILKPEGSICTITDTEELVRTREPMITYFPDILDVVKEGYPSPEEMK